MSKPINTSAIKPIGSSKHAIAPTGSGESSIVTAIQATPPIPAIAQKVEKQSITHAVICGDGNGEDNIGVSPVAYSTECVEDG